MLFVVLVLLNYPIDVHQLLLVKLVIIVKHKLKATITTVVCLEIMDADSFTKVL